MNRSGKTSFILFLAVIVLIFTAIALCALEKVNQSSTIGIIACGVCLPGFYYGFESWSEEKELEEQNKMAASLPYQPEKSDELKNEEFNEPKI